MNRRPSNLVLPLVLLQGLNAYCAGGTGNPEEEYRAAMEALYRGDLVGFYERLVPASYDRDLNSFLDEARELTNQPEFEQARQLLISFGDRVADQMQALTDDQLSPQVGLLAQSLIDIPSQLGLGSYEQFQQATIARILASLQEANLGRALRDPSVPVSWSRQKVKLIEQSEDRARLRVTSEEAPSSSDEKIIELILVEGKWIPLDLATQWDERVGQFRSYLDLLRSRKQSDPQYISRKLSELEQQLDFLTFLIADTLRTLAQQSPGR